MREFKVIVDDISHRHAVIVGEKAYTPLTSPQVERVIQHLLYPGVGDHSRNANSYCQVCKEINSLLS